MYRDDDNNIRVTPDTIKARLMLSADKWTDAQGNPDPFTYGAGYVNIPAALNEAHRVLRRGGRLFVLEFSTSEWPGFGQAYELYADKVIPRIGKAVADDEESYRYLVESIRRFPKPDDFRRMIADADFANARVEPMLGGLVCIWSGWKI